MYLLDTSVVLELLLDQEKADEVELFLRNTLQQNLHLSEFSLYSLGIALLRRRMHDTFLRSVDDMLVTSAFRLVRLTVEDMASIVELSRRFNLDIDDAYQYAAAEKYGLTIVSFDGDFDRTERGRKTPAQAMEA